LVECKMCKIFEYNYFSQIQFMHIYPFIHVNSLKIAQLHRKMTTHAKEA